MKFNIAGATLKWWLKHNPLFKPKYISPEDSLSVLLALCSPSESGVIVCWAFGAVVYFAAGITYTHLATVFWYHLWFCDSPTYYEMKDAQLDRWVLQASMMSGYWRRETCTCPTQKASLPEHLTLTGHQNWCQTRRWQQREGSKRGNLKLAGAWDLSVYSELGPGRAWSSDTAEQIKMLTQVTLPLHNQFTMVWRSPPNDAYANSDKLSSMVSRFVLISHNYNIHEAVAVPAVSRRSLIHGS